MPPLLANGMVLIWVDMLWGATMLVAGIAAAVALGLALVRRHRRGNKRAAAVALGLSVVPFVVLLVYAGPISAYGSAGSPHYFGLSVVPLVLSGLGVWLGWGDPPGDSSQ